MAETSTASSATILTTEVGEPEVVEVVIRCNYECPLWFEDISDDLRARALRYPNQYRIVKVYAHVLATWRSTFRTFELIQAQLRAAYEESDDD